MADYQQLVQAYIACFNKTNATIDDILAFYHQDMIWREMPNLFVPAGRTHPRTDLVTFWERGRTLLSGQTYTLRQVLVAGNVAAVQLDWEGTVAQAVGDFSAGQQLRAHLALFMEFQDGKIIRQTDYPCYYPFKALN